MTPARTALDLLAHYAACHRDERNIATQRLGMPLIVLGLGTLLARARIEWGGGEFSAAWLAFASCAVWYLSRRGAIALRLAVVLLLALFTLAAHAVARGGLGSWLAWGLGCLCVGALARYAGRCYEGPIRCHGAHWLAGPMFATAELLFAMGWNRDMRRQIEQRAGPTHVRDMAHPA